MGHVNAAGPTYGALLHVLRRLELAADRWMGHVEYLRSLIDAVGRHVDERGLEWGLEPVRSLVERIMDEGEKLIWRAIERFDELEPLRTGRSTIWLAWRGQKLVYVKRIWGKSVPIVGLRLGGISATATLGMGVLGSEEQRLYRLGWRASDGSVAMGRPTMQTTDLAQVFAWAPAVPGRVYIMAHSITLTAKGPHVCWWAKAKDHVETARHKSMAVCKSFSSPLTALGHVLGDGSPYIIRGRGMLSVSASVNVLPILVCSLDSIAGKVHVSRDRVSLWGRAAERVARWIVEGTPRPLRELLDTLQFGKWARLKAVMAGRGSRDKRGGTQDGWEDRRDPPFSPQVSTWAQSLYFVWHCIGAARPARGARRRSPKGSGPCGVGLRGFKSHPPHQP